MTPKTLLRLFRLSICSRSVCGAAALLLIGFFCTAFPSFAQDKQDSQRTTTAPHPATTPRDSSFHSPSLNREMHYRVLLPANYEVSTQRYPTLFLLHGLNGDYQNWSTRTSLAKYARQLNLIIVMPDAGNSWYVNSATDPADKYEDYIVKDFINEIDTHYRTIRKGSARAIAGLSMGGYAAVKFSLKYPRLFAYAGGISAALDASADLDTTHPEFRDGLRKAFGEAADPARPQNDVFALLTHAVLKDLPYLYLDCGSDDMFLAVNRKFVGRIGKLRVPYEFHEMPGGHTWNYWDAAIQRFLLMLAKNNFARGAVRRSMAQPI
jgi:putative tributyrin esterase